MIIKDEKPSILRVVELSAQRPKSKDDLVRRTEQYKEEGACLDKKALQYALIQQNVFPPMGHASKMVVCLAALKKVLIEAFKLVNGYKEQLPPGKVF